MPTASSMAAFQAGSSSKRVYFTDSSSFFARSGEFGFVQRVKVDCVDDTDNGGVNGTVFALSGEARGAAGNDQHGFAKAGVDCIYRDQVARLVAAFRIDGLYD